MTDDARVPHVRHPHVFDSFQNLRVNIVQFSATVLRECTPLFAGSVLVTEKPGKYLIDYRFHYSMPWAETSRLIFAIMP